MSSLRVLLAAVAALAAAGARADSISSLPDPLYAHTTPPQPDPIFARIRSIVYPTMGLPTLLPYGGEFDVFVHTESAEADPARWRVGLLLRPTGTAARFPLAVLAVARDHQRVLTKLRVRVPARAPREVYDLEVTGPLVRDTQPNAVRIYGEPRRQFRLAVVADHQLWDPSWKTRPGDNNARDYPRRGEREGNKAIARQELHEIGFLDPEFVVHVGDLLFGLEFPKEYEEGWRLWKEARFASFMLPGNHDAYATYGVRLKGTPGRIVQGLAACQQHFSAPFDWPKAFALLTCVFGDIKNFLFSDLRRDGLSYWRRTFGPPYYSWDYGDLHFVALNTYDGTPARRHSYALWVDAFDLHLGAPAVDNYGGQLGDEQLRWLEADLKRASQAGKTIVVFGHQDPRGNLAEPAETRYLPNQPFPTSPLGLGPFQEWHYEGAGWSSDGTGRVERLDSHSGTRLLRLLAAHASYYIDGHAHHDSHRVYAAGEEVAPGVRARRPIEFLRVTSAASVPLGPDDYWGYRVITVDGRSLLTAPYDGGRGLLSLPAGNFWTEEKAPTRIVAYNGLTHAVRGRLKFRLPRRPEGWKFLDAWGHVEVPLYDVAPDALGGSATFYVGVEVTAPPPTQGFPVKPGWQRKRLFEAVPAAGNRPPVAVIDVGVAGERPGPAAAEPAAASQPAVVFVGQRVTITTASSRDPDGDAIMASFITTPEGEEVRATEVQRTFAGVGRFKFKAEVFDARGSSARVEREVAVVLPPPPLQPGVAASQEARPPGTQPGTVGVKPRGCGCRVDGAAASGMAGAVLLVLLAFGRRRRRAL
ncbi:MAG: metallophosphoesterase [Deltaproteobacteria bacterium]|nr:metallophosphoesterase [Deltaproteobacteria bacterium]